MEIYNSKQKFILLLIFSTLSFLCGLKCILSDSVLIKIVGILNCVFAFVCLLVFISVLLTNKPDVVLNDEGISDRRILKRAIGWQEIEKGVLMVKGSQRHLVLSLKKNIPLSAFKYLYRKTTKGLHTELQITKINLSSSDFSVDELQKYLAKKLD